MHLLDRYKEAHFYTVMSLFNATEAQVHVYGQNTKPGENEDLEHGKGIAHKQKYTLVQRCLKLFVVLKQMTQTLSIQTGL